MLKLGRTYPAVREALSSTGRLDEAFYVERASTARQRVLPAADVDDAKVPYFSLAMVPGASRRPAAPTGSVAVVGLGPGDTDWMTPQSRRELAAATDLIGYGPYLDRIRAGDGQRRHPSDNTDEPARARLACTLAEQGRAVAVVSSGDPGVFAFPHPYALLPPEACEALSTPRCRGDGGCDPARIGSRGYTATSILGTCSSARASTSPSSIGAGVSGASPPTT